MARSGEATWEQLAATWQVSPATTNGDLAEALKRSADRQTTWMRVSLVAEVVVTVVVLGVVWWVLAAERGAALIWWGAAAVIHSLLVWGFTLWNRIGIWKPLGQSTVDYLRLTRDRLHRQRRTATFALWLVGVEAAALGGWLIAERRPDLRWSWHWVPAVVVTVSAIVWAIWSRRRAVVQLGQLIEVERQLALEGVG